ESLVLAEGTPLTHLQGDLYHYSFSSLSDHIRRLDKYSDLAAQEIIAQKKQAGWSNLVFSPSIKFLKVYFLKMGFMDGFYGFSISVISAFDVFLRYAKVRRLNMRNEGE
ncbi:MAG: hypothetical protein GWN59_03225, partial [Calditrichae bacterium]|nr:hypothetical protein [Calditrichia bacterium]